MTQEEILNYNRLCAEFLGWKIVDGIITWIPEESEFQHEVGYSAKGFLKFHSDWNWIMEVVETIEKIDNIDFYMEWFWLNGNNIGLYQRGKHNGITLWEYVARFSDVKTKKEAVVQAINQFLIFYNEKIQTYK